MASDDPVDQQIPSGVIAPIEIEFPRFSGKQPRLWISKAERYFKLFPAIDVRQRVLVASLHFHGDAERWCESFDLTLEKPTWKEFTQAVLDRFDSDPMVVLEEFRKLTQEGSVAEYVTRCEKLWYDMMSFFPEIPENFYVYCFVCGLKDELRFGIMTKKPTDLDEAIASARRQEKYVNALTKRFSQFSVNRADDTVAGREKNLCYNGDEVYSPNHGCKTSKATEEEIVHLEALDESAKCEKGFNTTVSKKSHKFTTMRLTGLVNEQKIQLLVSSGSSHCFIDENVARRLNCKVELDSSWFISVGGGSKCMSRGICREFKWEMQGQQFLATVRTMKLGGYDVVLGGDWLGKYSPVVFDYDQGTLSLTSQGLKVHLEFNTDQDDDCSRSSSGVCFQLVGHP